MIFFDIDGTLIDHESASAEASLRFYDHYRGALPFSRAEFPVIWEEILNKHFNRFCRGEISLWEQRRARMREVFGQDLSERDADARYQVFIREYEALTRGFEDAAPCLAKLRGMRLGIISNGAREQQIGKLQRAGLIEHFSVLLFSEDVGLGKPAPSIFLEACRLAGEDPKSCAHVGDNVEADVIPSRALGMWGIGLDRKGTLSITSPVIATLSELPELLSNRTRGILAATRRRLIAQQNPRTRSGEAMARRKLIAANWKMYKKPEETKQFFRDFLPLVSGHDRDEIVVCPPYVDLHAAIESARDAGIAIGAQNVHWKSEGAFTGEISPDMLVDVGCTHVIIGHSERRLYFGETDDAVNLKLKAALEHGLTPIVCVGEVLEEREAGLTEDVLRRQCVRAFYALSARKAARLVIAYEPCWAIGTGKTATPQLASEAHIVIRSEAGKAFGEDFAERLRILYGGSVKPENSRALMSEVEIDGALVGGASLDPKSFASIVKY